MGNNLKFYYWSCAVLIFLSISSTFLYPIYLGWEISGNSIEWAYFGNYLGGVLGPLFGLLAFVGVLLSIEYQKKENNKIDTQYKKQSIEERILKQIEFHHNISNNVRIPYDIERTKFKEGRLAFEFLYEKHLKTHYYETANQHSHLDEEQIIDISFSKLYNKEGKHFGVYFRNLFYLIKYIDESSYIDKKHFVRLVRAQLSTSEIQLLMYNCLFKKGKGFKDLVLKYDLLNGIDETEMIKPEHAKLFTK